MRIVIAGAGEIGTHLAKMLAYEDHQITIIDSEKDVLESLEESTDLLTYQASATSTKALKEIIWEKKTDLFIAVTYSEDTNITASMLAKRYGAKKTIARIRNLEFLEPSNIEFFKSQGIDSLISPELIAAREVLSLLHETGTTEYMEFSGGKLTMFVQKLDEKSSLIDRTLEEISLMSKMERYRVVAIKRKEETIIPRGNEKLQNGDMIFVISTKEGVEEIMKASGSESIEATNIMILGGSRIGEHVAEHIQDSANVKLILSDQDQIKQLYDRLNNTLVIEGDGRDVDLLVREGISQMDAFVAVTNNSETNILSCLLAKKMVVKKTIAEVENMDYISLAENSGIDTIINKKIAAASRIFRYTTILNITQVKYMTGTDAEILEFNVPSGAKITKGTL
ncbi:MAG: Trk system potassium transporter TrkA, partial [Bacteroidales bacterium]|nr:Trk system potassium transporter TrkA [Bacteroidales bacterium]